MLPLPSKQSKKTPTETTNSQILGRPNVNTSRQMPACACAPFCQTALGSIDLNTSLQTMKLLCEHTKKPYTSAVSPSDRKYPILSNSTRINRFEDNITNYETPVRNTQKPYASAVLLEKTGSSKNIKDKSLNPKRSPRGQTGHLVCNCWQMQSLSPFAKPFPPCCNNFSNPEPASGGVPRRGSEKHGIPSELPGEHFQKNNYSTGRPHITILVLECVCENMWIKTLDQEFIVVANIKCTLLAAPISYLQVSVF